MKPLALVERALENSSRPGDLVLDLFLGSGSTLVAAERTGRVCVGMELDPHYCHVVVARWEAFTGLKAEGRPRCEERGRDPLTFLAHRVMYPLGKEDSMKTPAIDTRYANAQAICSTCGRGPKESYGSPTQ